jgi:hypothetical protein
MDAMNKYKLLDDVENLVPKSTTNLWDGLRIGMDLILAQSSQPTIRLSPLHVHSTVQQNRLTTLFLLTDGMPNVVPPAGHIPELQKYLEARSPSDARSFSINTFGFGYSIDTPLLLEIARLGGGGYTFIPDASMVGTVFVNAVASAYAVYARRVKVDVRLSTPVDWSESNLEEFKIELKGQLQTSKTKFGIQFDAGDIQHGQPKHYVLDFTPSLPLALRVSATYRPVTSDSDALTNFADLQSSQEATNEELVNIEYHAAAFTLATILLTTTPETRNQSAIALEELHRRLTTDSGVSEHPYAAALARDVSGEAYASVSSPADFERWGKHYGPSLGSAHQQQYCQNFKDDGLQRYSNSPVFREERSKLGSTFCLLPSPRPSSEPWTLISPRRSTELPLSPHSSTISSSQTMSTLSRPSSLDSPLLPRSPSPEYQLNLAQFAQYAPDQTASQPSRQSSLSALRGLLAQRRQRQPSRGISSSHTTSASPLVAGPGSLSLEPPVTNELVTLTTWEPMSLYLDPDAPCFAGGCLVRMPGDASPVRVDELRRGTIVQTLKGPRTVAAVVRTSVRRGNLLLCRLGELAITPWHPVRLPVSDAGRGGEVGKWVFPADIATPAILPCDAVYSVLLERDQDSGPCAHTISVSGVWCVTLGHGVLKSAGSDVRAHVFLGDYDRVLKEISRLDGFFEEGGVVRCAGTRKGSDGLTCGFVRETAACPERLRPLASIVCM